MCCLIGAGRSASTREVSKGGFCTTAFDGFKSKVCGQTKLRQDRIGIEAWALPGHRVPNELEQPAFSADTCLSLGQAEQVSSDVSSV